MPSMTVSPVVKPASDMPTARNGEYQMMHLRYSPMHQLLHWMTVGLMLAVLPLGWVVISLPEDTPIFYFWLYVHEGVGLSILLITAFRIAWRIRDRPPRLPPSVRMWARAIALCVGGFLLVALITMPISGYLWSMGHGHDVVPFNLFAVPRLAFGKTAIGDYGKLIHQWGQWLVYTLILLHLLGVGYHVVVKRDGTLARMLPSGALDLPEKYAAIPQGGKETVADKQLTTCTDGPALGSKEFEEAKLP